MSEPTLAPTPCTCFRMRKLTRLMTQRYDRALAPAGLNINQYSLLRRAGIEPRAIGELAQEMGMDRSTLSRDLKPLAAAGWVDIATGDDARRRVIKVTAAGWRAIAKAKPLWREAQDEIEGLIGSAGTQRLHTQLDFALRRLQSGDAR